MYIKNTKGDTIYLDDRYDVDLIKQLISKREYDKLDNYLSTIKSFPSHAEGGVNIDIEEDGVYINSNKSKIKITDGLILSANKDNEEYNQDVDENIAIDNDSEQKQISDTSEKEDINIKAEKGELIIKNSNGDYAIIPSKYRREVEDMIENKCFSCIDKLVETLPLIENYTKEDTTLSELYKLNTHEENFEQL